MNRRVIAFPLHRRLRDGDGGAACARPSLLAVTSQIPWPLDCGGHLRSFHLLRALASRFRVRLVTGVLPHQQDTVEALRGAGIDVCPAALGERRWPIEALRIARAVYRNEAYVLYRRHDRTPVWEALRREIEREPPDLFYLDHLDSTIFASLCHSAPMVIDLHNVYSSLVRRAAAERHGIMRRFLLREAHLLERAERRAAGLGRVLFSVSEEEERYFRSLDANTVAVVPNGVDCRAYERVTRPLAGGPPTILYVGTMSWEPNAHAAEFLARHVFPLIRAQLPGARLRIVGADPTREVRALGDMPHVEVTGRVDSIFPYLAEAHALAVPLETGGGSRLKILEAFAAGLPVVSTPVGCEGIAATHQKHLLVANRDDFATALRAVLTDPALAARLAKEARALVRQRYDWTAVGDTAVEAALSALSGWPDLLVGDPHG